MGIRSDVMDNIARYVLTTKESSPESCVIKQ